MIRHWTINGRFLTQPVTGVQRYGREVVQALDRQMAQGHPLARDLEIELVAPPDIFDPLPLTAIRTHIVGGAGGHAWEQAVLAGRARGGTISLTNTGPLLARKHIVCIHDVNTRAFPASYSRPFRMLYRALMPALGRSAIRVATVSHYSADQLVAHGICKAEKLLVAPNGHEHALQWTPAHTEVTCAAAGRDTIVLLGSQAPHKNVGLVLSIAGRLAEAGLRIALAGHADPHVFQSAGIARADNVQALGRLPDAALAALLQDSLCLAFPSFVEGFGLPPLEAMALGCPVVVSDRASLPEICGDSALYASPTDPEAWLDSFLRLRNEDALRAGLVARGRARAADFSWSTTAQLYLRAMAVADGLPVEDEAPADAPAAYLAM
ncbi:glycosyltransferase family 1 protein [Aquabacter sp. CN5-332]|uniref:glycosyltransferase family 4 protein n=1 Tax=Aquabacter sp. CN5-332 TaxID=3156608 RepID=UPI0032B53EB4